MASDNPQYLCDINKAGMLYAAILRSDVKQGRIREFNLSALPPGYTFFSAKDVPAKNTLRTIDTNLEVFCEKHIRYLGQPLGILIGPDPKETRRLLNSIKVVLDEKWEPSDSGDAILASRKLRTGVFDLEDAIDAYFKMSPFEESDIFSYKEERQDWLEQAGVVTYMDSGSLIILSSTKWPYHLQKSLSAALGLDEDKILIKKLASRNSNSSGTVHTSILGVQCALATVLTGKCVKLVLSHYENRYFSPPLDIKTTIRTAFSDDGKLRALQAYIDVYAGWSNPFAKEIADRLAIAITAPYSIEHMAIDVVVHQTQSAPTSIPAENVDSAAFFALENHLNHIASVIDVLPQELRLANIDDATALFKYKNISYQDTISSILKNSDFNRKYATFKNIAKENFADIAGPKRSLRYIRKRGIALSCALEGSYYYGSKLLSMDQKMEVTLTREGQVVIGTPSPSAACAALWKTLASKLLKISEDNILIASEKKDKKSRVAYTKNKLPENLLSNISLMTMLLKKCCAQIQKQRFQTPLPITSKKGITVGMKKQWDNDNFWGYPFYSTSYGSCILECLIDPISYNVTISALNIAIDCGEVFSLVAATNAVKLAIYRELEKLCPNESVPLEKINISFVSSNNPPCQIGSLIHNLISSAFTSAVGQAIGSTIKTLPLDAATIYKVTEINAPQDKESAK